VGKIIYMRSFYVGNVKCMDCERRRGEYFVIVETFWKKYYLILCEKCRNKLAKEGKIE